MNRKVLLDIIRTRRVVFVVVAFLLIADMGLFLYRSYLQGPRLETLYATWSQNRRILAAKQKVSKAEIYRRGVQDLATFNATILQKREFVRLVGELYETAANNGLKVGSISYKPAQVKGRQLYAFAVSVQVTGGYAGIKSFIGDVARSREMLVIDNISLTSGGITEKSVRMQMAVTAYMKQEEQ